jgi:dynein heavy chain 1, cytosolic
MSLFEALKKRSDIEIREFIRLVLHEGLRIFSDRLVSEEERLWTDNTINEILMKNFPCKLSYSTIQRVIIIFAGVQVATNLC